MQEQGIGSEQHEEEVIDVVVNSDGGIVTGPFGPRGVEVTMTSIAYVITRPADGYVLEEFGRMTGKTGTNSDAEYEAAILAVSRCIELGATRVKLRVDSQMVERQITGQYQCKHAHLRAHLRHVKSHIKRLNSFEVEWVPREENGRADQLCNRAMNLYRYQCGLPSREEARKLRAQEKRQKGLDVEKLRQDILIKDQNKIRAMYASREKL